MMFSIGIHKPSGTIIYIYICNKPNREPRAAFRGHEPNKRWRREISLSIAARHRVSLTHYTIRIHDHDRMWSRCILLNNDHFGVGSWKWITKSKLVAGQTISIEWQIVENCYLESDQFGGDFVLQFAIFAQGHGDPSANRASKWDSDRKRQRDRDRVENSLQLH